MRLRFAINNDTIPVYRIGGYDETPFARARARACVTILLKLYNTKRLGA